MATQSKNKINQANYVGILGNATNGNVIPTGGVYVGGSGNTSGGLTGSGLGQWTGNFGQYTIPITTTSSGNGFWTGYNTAVSAKPNPAYVIFKLPKRKIPELVFVNGRALTIGAFGSRAECAYYYGQFIFNYSTLFTIVYGGDLTLIVQYKDAIYHYSLPHENYGLKLKEGSNIIDAQLLSVVPRE